MNNKVNKKKFNQRGGEFTIDDILLGFVWIVILGAIGASAYGIYILTKK